MHSTTIRINTSTHVHQGHHHTKNFQTPVGHIQEAYKFQAIPTPRNNHVRSQITSTTMLQEFF